MGETPSVIILRRICTDTGEPWAGGLDVFFITHPDVEDFMIHGMMPS